MNVYALPARKLSSNLPPMLRIHLPIMERDKKGELKRGEASLT
jgi:hypothetical protein